MNQQTKSSSRRRVRLKPTIAHVMLFWMALSTVAYSPTNNRYMHEVASQIRDMDMQRMGQGSPRLRHQTEQDFLGSDQYVDMANSIRRNNFHPPPPPPTDPYEEQLFNVAGPRFQPSSAFRDRDGLGSPSLRKHTNKPRRRRRFRKSSQPSSFDQEESGRSDMFPQHESSEWMEYSEYRVEQSIPSTSEKRRMVNSIEPKSFGNGKSLFQTQNEAPEWSEYQDSPGYINHQVEEEGFVNYMQPNGNPIQPHSFRDEKSLFQSQNEAPEWSEYTHAQAQQSQPQKKPKNVRFPKPKPPPSFEGTYSFHSQNGASTWSGEMDHSFTEQPPPLISRNNLSNHNYYGNSHSNFEHNGFQEPRRTAQYEPTSIVKVTIGVTDLPDTQNPYALLGMDPEYPPKDTDELRKAFRDRAKIYHPDSRTNKDSTPEERKQASKDFAKINQAYRFLRENMIKYGNDFYATTMEPPKYQPFGSRSHIRRPFSKADEGFVGDFGCATYTSDYGDRGAKKARDSGYNGHSCHTNFNEGQQRRRTNSHSYGGPKPPKRGREVANNCHATDHQYPPFFSH